MNLHPLKQIDFIRFLSNMHYGIALDIYSNAECDITFDQVCSLLAPFHYISSNKFPVVNQLRLDMELFNRVLVTSLENK